MSNREISDYSFEYLIVGAGASGLYLANLLQKHRLDYCIVDQNSAPLEHSRSIGIHPPSLNLFKDLGIFEDFLENGVKITTGIAFINKNKVGELPLSSGTGTDVVLSIPQYKTEAILEKQLDSTRILRGHKVVNFTQKKGFVFVHAEVSEKGNSDLNSNESSGAVLKIIKCRYLIGVDGMHSFIRKKLGTPWIGSKYPVDFCMGDFPDNSEFDSDAAIFLNKSGLTESFPLPGGMRRWVINIAQSDIQYDSEKLCKIVEERTGILPDNSEVLLFSRFSIYRYQAKSLVAGNVILLGDSAHVMSPIGGQGMNIAWINGHYLFHCLMQARKKPDIAQKSLLKYNKIAIKNFQKYANRAEFNTNMGLPDRNMFWTSLFVKIVLKRPFSSIIGRRFTMR